MIKINLNDGSWVSGLHPYTAKSYFQTTIYSCWTDKVINLKKRTETKYFGQNTMSKAIFNLTELITPVITLMLALVAVYTSSMSSVELKQPRSS